MPTKTLTGSRNPFSDAQVSISSSHFLSVFQTTTLKSHLTLANVARSLSSSRNPIPMTALESHLFGLSETVVLFAYAYGLPSAVFEPGDPLPEKWGHPFFRVREGLLHRVIMPNPFHRAIALRQTHDPDELSDWVFVPIPVLNEVWLAHIAPNPCLS